MRLITLFSILCLILSCIEKEKNQIIQIADSTKQKYLLKGAEIAGITRAELFKNVSRAMKNGGPVYAVEFCNIKALFLNDSLSQLYNCQIRRLALKYRNPADMPQSGLEKEQLNEYQQAFQKNEPLLPSVYQIDNRIEYYQPIMISKEACLNCHGDPNTHITKETLEKINEHYPNDLATGFALNDFRGAWKITFDEQ